MNLKKAHRALLAGYDARAKGKLLDAKAHFVRALDWAPTNEAALLAASSLALQLNQAKRDKDEHVIALSRLAIEAGSVAAMHNLATFHHQRGELAESRALYERCLARSPMQGETWKQLGDVLMEMGRPIPAKAAWLRSLECPATSPGAHFSRSFLELAMGDYADGWKDYEARWDSPEFTSRHPIAHQMPWWDGKPLDGALLLHQEQGAGDAIMMSRFIPWAAERCTNVYVEVIAGLVDLFVMASVARDLSFDRPARPLPNVRIFERGTPIPCAISPTGPRVHLPMMSIPAAFGLTTIDTIPPAHEGFALLRSSSPTPNRVGLCWQGSTIHTNDRVRSMPFEACHALLDVPGHTWQSLQFGYDVSAPLDPLPMGSFLDTAQAIASCSLVITVDTSIAHLAGSMGVPTWVLVPYHADWRWLMDRSDSPWYPSVTVFRQAKPGDWFELTQRVANDLNRNGQ